MKILICGSRGIPAQYGGFESLAQALADNFNKDKHVVIVTGFNNQINFPVVIHTSGCISYQVPARGPRFFQNFLCTWKATKALDEKYKFEAAIVLNDVNYFIARKYLQKGSRTVLHLDGAEPKRTGLPLAGKLAHWFFRQLAIKSQIPLVVDSAAIKEDLKLSSLRANVISYAPHKNEPKKPYYEKISLEPNGFFVVIARFVKENKITEIIDWYIASGRKEQLLVIGLGTGSKRYEACTINASQRNDNIYVLPKNYNRSEINWLLQNAKGYIHGHSVGGTNPILVDARFHSKLILSHDNSYNRENRGYKEFFWNDDDQLVNLLQNIDSLVLFSEVDDYELDSWETITSKYLEILSQRN